MIGKFIGIDTSQTVAGVAVFFDGAEVATTVGEAGVPVSSALGNQVSGTLRLAGIEPSELAGIVVSTGPGSVTGLRVGIAYARGLADALDLAYRERSVIDTLRTNFGPEAWTAVYAGADTVVLGRPAAEKEETVALREWDRVVAEIPAGERLTVTEDLLVRIRGAVEARLIGCAGDLFPVRNIARLLLAEAHGAR